MLSRDQMRDADGVVAIETSPSFRTMSASAPIDHRETALSFRNFRIWPRARLLMRGEDTLCIGSRAFDLLLVLLLSRGQVVEKSEILQRVWPATIVDESNLRFQIATLRKVLGRDRDLIMSIPGRGYFFAFDPIDEGLPRQVNELQRIDALTATADRVRLLERFDHQLYRARAETGGVEHAETDFFSLVVHLAGILAAGEHARPS